MCNTFFSKVGQYCLGHCQSTQSLKIQWFVARYVVMAKAAKITRSIAKPATGYKVVGQAKDGIWILRPSVKPTHFSAAQARASVAKVMKESDSGRLKT
jgi:hypothetical protein